MTMRMRVFVLAALLTVACSCALWPAGAPYDPLFEAGLVNLQKDVRVFFDEVGKYAGTGQGTHSAFASDYRTFSSRIAGLRGQAASHARNGSTLQSLDLLRESFDKVEAMHRQGLVAEEAEILRSLVDTQLRLLLGLERAKRGAAAEAS